ncbi:MAG: hypothetical protein WC444_06605 [Candidatus Paceibacterota bacterium]
MTNYKEYSDAKEAISHCISNKEQEIAKIEIEIIELKHTRRMLDEEFKKKLNEKPNFIG